MTLIGQNYIDPNDVMINYKINHKSKSVQNRISFKHCDLPIFGVGPYGIPVINCDPYIDISLLGGLEEEFNNNLHHASTQLHKMIPFGLVPFSINQEKCIDSYLINLDKYDSLGQYKSYGDNNLHYHEFKDMVCTQFKLNKPWHDVLHIRELKSFFEKNHPSRYNKVAMYFPKLCKFIDSLPFESVGYAMVMRNKPNNYLNVHRDIFMQNHSCHHINVAIDLKPRKFFVYDSIEKIKIYKTENSLSYFFNECDLHGADSVDDMRLTLRVDGIFTDKFAQSIGLERGKTFDWYYDKPQDYIKQVKKIPILDETDI